MQASAHRYMCRPLTYEPHLNKAKDSKAMKWTATTESRTFSPYPPFSSKSRTKASEQHISGRTERTQKLHGAFLHLQIEASCIHLRRISFIACLVPSHWLWMVAKLVLRTLIAFTQMILTETIP